MNTLIRCIHIVYGLVEAVELEQIAKEVTELQKREDETGHPGYTQPGGAHGH